jgi:hypothetical protein
MDLEFHGRVFATPSAITMVVDGAEVHSGQVGAGQPLDTDISLVNLANLAPGSTVSATVTVTSGVVSAGPIWEPLGEDEYGPDLRVSSSILINGSPPEWPATPVEPMPGGTPEDPDWARWSFELGAGETITFNFVVPEPPPPPPNPT